MRDDRIEEPARRLVERRGRDGIDRLGSAAEDLIEAQEKARAEAAAQRGARLVEKIADALQAETAERKARRGIEPQRLDRQPFDGGPFPARRDADVRGACVTRERPAGAGRIGERKPRRQAEACKAATQIGDQRRLAAEEMAGARDVEEEPVGAVLLIPGAGRGRVAGCPERETVERRGIGLWIEIAHLQPARLRPRVGDPFSCGDALGASGLVESRDLGAAGGVERENEGPGRINRLGGGPAVLRLQDSAGSASDPTRPKGCAA